MQKEDSNSDLTQQEEAEIKGRFKVKHIKSAEETSSSIAPVTIDLDSTAPIVAVESNANAVQQKKSRFTVKTIVNKEEEVSVDSGTTPRPSTAVSGIVGVQSGENSHLHRLENGFEQLMASHQRLLGMMQEIMANQVALSQQSMVGSKLTGQHITSSASSNSLISEAATEQAGAGAASVTTDKDKSFAKMTHFLNEMRRELECASKQRKEQNLETKRLREKCQQLEDKLAVEISRSAAMEDRAEKSKLRITALQSQLDTLLSSQHHLHHHQQQQQQLTSQVGAEETSQQQQTILSGAATLTAPAAPDSSTSVTASSSSRLSASVADEADLRLLSST